MSNTKDSDKKWWIEEEMYTSLTELVTLIEFVQIFWDQYAQRVAQRTAVHMQDYESLYELTEDQKTRLKEIIVPYLAQKIALPNYYRADKSKITTTKGTLKYQFERRVKRLLEEAGVKIGTKESISNRTYQWR